MEIVRLRSGRHGMPFDDERIEALRRDLRGAVRGDVRFDDQSRALHSMDASIFRIVPAGVVTPRDADDVVAAMTVMRAHGAPVVHRGGGTSIAGQCLGKGVVFDFSRYFNRILGVDVQEGEASVEPGLVLDRLREITEPSGLTYGPDPSTHDRCTFGGMLGNDACGIHAILSEFYGDGARTSHNVRSLEVLTYDGARMRVGKTDEATYEAILRRGGREAEIYRRLRALRERYADAIRDSFPDIPRRVSGYNLPALLPENGFDVAASLVGSEGTLATFLESTVALAPHFPGRAMLVLGYEDAFAAGDHVPRIREFRPIGLEGMDALLIDFVRAKRMHPERLRMLPEGGGFLLVEFGDRDARGAVARAEACREALRSEPHAPTAVVVEDPEEQKGIWAVRKSALGATHFVPGRKNPWPGWEDSAVPVDRVGDYLRALRALYDRYGYEGSFYGHFGQGCIHTRTDFDLESREGIAQYRSFMEDAADLVVSFGGSLSGEHGDGQLRSELLPRMYPPEIIQAFREMKAIWDPEGKMNPGRIVDPAPLDADLRLGPDHDIRRPDTRFRFESDGGDFSHAALRCVGVGKCRKDSGGVMCPSYRATREEAHSTRGRARLLYEMALNDVIDDGFESEEVKSSLDLCLSCKGCKADCPVDVDIATYKAEFLYHYYQNHRRPRQALAFGRIRRWATFGAAAPRALNAIAHAPGVRGLLKLLAGVASERQLPYLASTRFTKAFKKRKTLECGEFDVVLWPDTFHDCFVPSPLFAAADLLEQAGGRVRLPPAGLCCGRPLYDFGLLDQAVHELQKIVGALAEEIDRGIPVVGIEPSCVAVFRDELVGLLGDDPRARRLSEQTYTIEEFLLRYCPELPLPSLEGQVLLQGHCQGRSVMGIDADAELLRRCGLDVHVLDEGCCGMAGAFGFEAGDKYAISKTLAEAGILKALREAGEEATLVTDGFSCREQVRQLDGRRPLHVAEILRRGLDVPRSLQRS